MAMKYWTTKQAKLATVEPPSVVAELTGKSVVAVNSFKARNGLTATPRYFTPEDDAAIIAGRKRGDSYRKISAKIGRNDSNVYRRYQWLVNGIKRSDYRRLAA